MVLPDVSVLMPVRDGAPHLERALNGKKFTQRVDYATLNARIRRLTLIGCWH